MKNYIKHLVIAAAVLGALTIPAKALTITTTISSTTANVTQAFMLFPNESMTYSLTGTATGQLLIERSQNASEWSPAGVTVTGAGAVSSSGTLYSGPSNTYYRIRRSTMTAGSLTTVLADVNDLVKEFKNNKNQTIVAINDDNMVVSGGFIATSSTFTDVHTTGGTDTNPTLTGAITVTSGSTITYSGTLESGTRTNNSTTTMQGAVINGTKTDNSTTTVTGGTVYSGATRSGTATDSSTTTYSGGQTFNGFTQIKQSTATPPSGYRGTVISSVQACGASALALTNGQYRDIVAVVLPAGTWDLTGSVLSQSSSVTGSSMVAGYGTVTGNDGTGVSLPETEGSGGLPTNSFDMTTMIPKWRTTITTQTTYYLKAQMGITGGSAKACGQLTAEAK